MGAINEFKSIAFASSAVAGTALDLSDIGFTDENIANANVAWISSIGTDAINYRVDGGTVVAGAGHIVQTSEPTMIYGNTNIKNFSCIRASGSSATIAITLFK